jgi:hypothetical protein
MAIAQRNAGVSKTSRQGKQWVSMQRKCHTNDELGIDRKKNLDALHFVWNVEEHAWHLQRQKLVAFKRKRQRRLGPFDMSLSFWVDIMQKNHANNTM